MVSSGLMGLFTGAVLLAMGYQLLMAWVDRAAPAAAGPGPGEATGQEGP
jgi:hypothetical protein